MSFFDRLKSGLKKTATSLAGGLKAAVGLSQKLDTATREALEEALLSADVGVTATHALLDDLQKRGLPEPLTEEALRQALYVLMVERLRPLAMEVPLEASPTVLVLAGVNGSGKTTTLGKLAAQWAQQGKQVVIAAADTFRAAAVEQLDVWAQRAAEKGKKSGSVVILPPAKPGADPAGVAYAALEQAQRDKADLVLIDTAGRLPNRTDLLAELAKINRVLAKLDPKAPHGTLLVLDATLGQSTLAQVRAFSDVTPVTGLIITKLDASAKAGFLLALAAQPSPLPVYAIGFGEQLDDLGPFDPEAFARSLLGM